MKPDKAQAFRPRNGNADSQFIQSLAWRKSGQGWQLIATDTRRRFGKVFPDKSIPGMWRSALAGGRVSDMANLSWARNAVLEAAILEIQWEARQQPATAPPISQEIRPVFSRESPQSDLFGREAIPLRRGEIRALTAAREKGGAS